jgi:hypothetical protein
MSITIAARKPPSRPIKAGARKKSAHGFTTSNTPKNPTNEANTIPRVTRSPRQSGARTITKSAEVWLSNVASAAGRYFNEKKLQTSASDPMRPRKKRIDGCAPIIEVRDPITTGSIMTNVAADLTSTAAIGLIALPTTLAPMFMSPKEAPAARIAKTPREMDEWSDDSNLDIQT